MENNENLVTEVTENVEGTTTEETVEQVVEEPAVKTYTDDEVNQIVGRKLARQEAKIRKEYGRKYGNLESVLKAGTGKDSVEEITDTFSQFYKERGVEFPQEPIYSAKDTEVLAGADAKEIIESGFDEVVEEADRLNELGVANMTAREKALFVKLTEHIKSTETNRELERIGVGEDVYGSKEFKDFASKFNSNIPITEIYQIYNSTKPKKEIKTMGSIKNTATADEGVKDFYSFEEASKFTVDDFNKNPALYEAVKKSMTKW